MTQRTKKGFSYGLHVKWANGQKTPDVRWTCHDRSGLKSIAGRLFHLAEVLSVCVYTASGSSRFYLRKNADGSIHREEA